MLVENNVQDEIYTRGVKSKNILTTGRGIQLRKIQKQCLPPVQEEIKWQELLLNVQNKISDRTQLTIGDESIKLDSELKCKFIKNATKKTYPASIDEYLMKTKGVSAIDGDGFGEEKNQLYVSERFLDKLGVDKSKILGKYISLKINYEGIDIPNERYVLDNDLVFDNAHSSYKQKNELVSVNGNVSIFSNYKIVGIVRQEYYDINELTKSDADLWFKDETLIEGNVNLMPKISMQDLYIWSEKESESKIVLTYNTLEYIEYSKTVTEKGCFFPFLLGNSYIAENRGENNNIMPIEVNYVQCDDFSSARKYCKQCKNYFEDNNTNGVLNGNYYAPCSQEFSRLEDLTKAINVCGIIFALMGIEALVGLLIKYIKTHRRQSK